MVVAETGHQETKKKTHFKKSHKMSWTYLQTQNDGEKHVKKQKVVLHI